jgi:hypothetical protein
MLSGAAAAWPGAACVQQATMPVVAFLAVGSPDALRARVVAFRKGLSETGYVEGRNVAVEYHWLEGNYERLPAVLDNVKLDCTDVRSSQTGDCLPIIQLQSRRRTGHG